MRFKRSSAKWHPCFLRPNVFMFVHSCTLQDTSFGSCSEQSRRQRIAPSGPKHHQHWFGLKRGGLCTSFSGGRKRGCCSCGGLWQLHPHSDEERELFKCFWQRYTNYLTKVHSRYFAVCILQRTQKRHPIARPCGRAMGYLIWVHSLNNGSAFFPWYCL